MYSETTINLAKVAFEEILSIQKHRKKESTIAEMLHDRYWDAPTTPEKKRCEILLGYLYGYTRKENGMEVLNFYTNPLHTIKAIMLGAEDYSGMPYSRSNLEKIKLGREAVEAMASDRGAGLNWDR